MNLAYFAMPESMKVLKKNDGITSQGHENQNEVTFTHQIRDHLRIKITKDSIEL